MYYGRPVLFFPSSNLSSGTLHPFAGLIVWGRHTLKPSRAGTVTGFVRSVNPRVQVMKGFLPSPLYRTWSHYVQCTDGVCSAYLLPNFANSCVEDYHTEIIEC